jgi:hypothetical protein
MPVVKGGKYTPKNIKQKTAPFPTLPLIFVVLLLTFCCG